MAKQRIQKLITFSPQLYTLVEDKAQRLGITFPEYIRSLAVEDIKEGKAPYLVASAELSDEVEYADSEIRKDSGKKFDPEDPADVKDLFEDA